MLYWGRDTIVLLSMTWEEYLHNEEKVQAPNPKGIVLDL
jgi:hypothetical protein